MKQIGPAPEGLPVLQKTISSVPGAGHKYQTVSEVTELFEGTLPENLFQPPDGYQRVTNLPHADRREPPTWAGLVRDQLQQILGWFSALF